MLQRVSRDRSVILLQLLTDIHAYMALATRRRCDRQFRAGWRYVDMKANIWLLDADLLNIAMQTSFLQLLRRCRDKRQRREKSITIFESHGLFPNVPNFCEDGMQVTQIFSKLKQLNKK